MTEIKKRDYYFDNAKCVLIFLVVLGHFISPIKQDKSWLYALYNFIYTFHMPAFILLAGFFTKQAEQIGYLKILLKKLLVPYLVFQVLYTIYYYGLYGKSEIKLTFFDPHWSLWFMLSLLFWNVMLTVFIKFRYPIAIALALGIAIGYLTMAGTYLSVSRTFVFFPFFLVGHFLQKEHLQPLFRKPVRIVSSCLLVITFIAYQTWIPRQAKDWLLGDSSYTDILGNGHWYGGLVRLGFYALAFIATFSVLAIIPRRKLFYTKMGERTLYVYLLHGFILKYLLTTPLFNKIIKNEMYGVLIVLSALVCAALASKPITMLTQPLIELKWTKIRNQIR